MVTGGHAAFLGYFFKSVNLTSFRLTFLCAPDRSTIGVTSQTDERCFGRPDEKSSGSFSNDWPEGRLN